MPHIAALRNRGKVAAPPRRPFEKERLDAELKLCGEYGLKNKREIWRVSKALSNVRNSARDFLTKPENDPQRLFEGAALLRRLHRLGVLDEQQNKLDYILSLKIQDFLERRLQTIVFKLRLAKSIHHARVLIKQRHIRVGAQVVDVASFMVRVDSEKYIDFATNSPLGGGPPGRTKRKKLKAKAKPEEGAEGAEEEE